MGALACRFWSFGAGQKGIPSWKAWDSRFSITHAGQCMVLLSVLCRTPLPSAFPVPSFSPLSPLPLTPLFCSHFSSSPSSFSPLRSSSCFLLTSLLFLAPLPPSYHPASPPYSSTLSPASLSSSFLHMNK